jgi:hypothetical protein
MRVAYADPPYLGLSAFYKKHHERAMDYDDPAEHQRLIDRLCDEFPDGWAMSLHSPALRVILPMCPADCRVSAWVKPFCSFKPNVLVAYAWEPVIWRGGRKRAKGQDTVRDWMAESITLQRGLVGAKPERFCFWLFTMLGLRAGDEFVDLFPGTGGVSAAWASFQAQSPRLFAEPAPRPTQDSLI